jgi:hypothetical protein
MTMQLASVRALKGMSFCHYFRQFSRMSTVNNTKLIGPLTMVTELQCSVLCLSRLSSPPS